MLHHVIRGTGRPVILLHGVTLDHRHMVETWEPIFEAIPGWKRIYVDLPGHGQSAGDESVRSNSDILDRVMAFAEQVVPGERFALIGESRGSYIAQGVAHVRPDLVTGLGLIVPGGWPGSPPERFPTQQTLRPAPELRTEVPPERISRFDWLVVQTKEILDKTRRTKWAVTALADLGVVARTTENFFFPFDVHAPDVPFAGPSLIVAGRQDHISGFADAVDGLPVYPRATLAVLDTAGHAAAWERPALFTALAQDWLERLAFEVTA